MGKRKSPPASAAVQKSIDKTVAAGGARVTLTLNTDEAEAWRLLVARYPGRGGQKRAFMEAVLDKLDAPAPTGKRAIAQLRELLDTLEREIER
jgi:hypothetical protein